MSTALAKPEASMPATVENPVPVIDLAALAANPDVSVDKLERLVAMQERMAAAHAKAAFDDAFAEMQGALPVIIEHARTDKASYAPLEDIVETVRPILARHGFSLSHETQWPGGGIVRIIGILSHRQGHERRAAIGGWPMIPWLGLLYLGVAIVVAIVAHGTERDRGERPRMDRWGLR